MEQAQKIKKNWTSIVRKYMKPDAKKSYIQIINSIIPYLLCWVAAYFAYDYSLWLCLPIVLISQAFLLRIFIIMHDCGHGSFFKSKRQNDFWGVITGVLTFTPYHQWTACHKYHHKHSGNLDYRGIGDIDTLTVEEYKALSGWGKFKYKLLRSPFVFLIFGGLYVFIIEQRFTFKEDGPLERKSVHFTNFALLLQVLVCSYFLGWKFYLFFQVLSICTAASAGIFLFYVQHQFENVYWADSKEWSHLEASLKGCSYLKLPKLFQWVTGNIGFHHIHHLCSSIPNYNLEKAYKENPMLQNCNVLGIRESFKCLFLSLYDLKEKKMISFRTYRRSLRKAVAS